MHNFALKDEDFFDVMLGFNKVILIGTVGRNPETRYIAKGFSQSAFSLATNELVNSAIGRQVEETEWHEVVSYGDLSAFADQFVHKGDTVMVEGKLKSRYIREHDGFRTKVVEVFADKIQIVARCKANSESPIPEGNADKEPSAQAEKNAAGTAIPGYDIDNLPNFGNISDNLPF